jgi:hypothetical protein
VDAIEVQSFLGNWGFAVSGTFGSSLEALWELSGSSLGALWELSGSSLGALWELSGSSSQLRVLL